MHTWYVCMMKCAKMRTYESQKGVGDTIWPSQVEYYRFQHPLSILQSITCKLVGNESVMLVISSPTVFIPVNSRTTESIRSASDRLSGLAINKSVTSGSWFETDTPSAADHLGTGGLYPPCGW